MGRGGNRVRERVQRLKHSRGYISDTSAIDFFGDPTAEREKQQCRYVQVMGRSKFVLCPPGAGPASFRIFETMFSGRVPVIVSDLWVPPAGPDWKNCALTVKERDVHKLGGSLKKRRNISRGWRGRRGGMERWFAPDVLFHRMAEDIKEIMETRAVAGKRLEPGIQRAAPADAGAGRDGELKSYPAARARSGRLSWRSQ